MPLKMLTKMPLTILTTMSAKMLAKMLSRKTQSISRGSLSTSFSRQSAPFSRRSLSFWRPPMDPPQRYQRQHFGYWFHAYSQIELRFNLKTNHICSYADECTLFSFCWRSFKCSGRLAFDSFGWEISVHSWQFLIDSRLSFCMVPSSGAGVGSM